MEWSADTDPRHLGWLIGIIMGRVSCFPPHLRTGVMFQHFENVMDAETLDVIKKVGKPMTRPLKPWTNLILGAIMKQSKHTLF